MKRWKPTPRWRVSLNRFARRWSPMRLIEHWEASYFDRNNGLDPSDDAWEPNITWRFHVARYVMNAVDRITATWHVLGTHDRHASWPDGGVETRPARAFYRLKAGACLLLNIQPKTEKLWTLDDVLVVFYGLDHYDTPDGPGGECQEVRVGLGYFENWFAYIQRESWP